VRVEPLQLRGNNMAVNPITGMEDLPEVSKLTGAFPAAPKGYIGPKELAPALKEVGEKEMAAQEELAKSDIRLEQAKREEEAQKSEKMKGFYEGEKKALEQLPERATYKQSVEELNAAKFEPTKDTLQDIAGLFSLMGVIGTIIGKGNATQAMYAMNGMMEGHIKGRRDLVKQQAVEFDKNFKALQTKVDAAYKELQDAVALRTYDQKAGQEAVTMAIARAGSPLLKEMEARQGPLRTLAFLKDVKENTLGNSVKLNNDLKAKAEERAIRAAKSAGKAGYTSALLAGRAENIREAFVQATQDLLNVTRFPPDTVLGAFAGMTGQEGTGLIQNLSNTFAREVTDDESRLLQQLVSGLETNMATALGGGYASSSSKYKIDQYKQQIPKAGDSGYVAANFLARMRQELNILNDNFATKPGATPEMAKAVDEANQRLNRAIPFTVEDVTDAYFSGISPPRAQAEPRAQSSSSGGWTIKEKK
jgi:hypothetical protein